MIEDKLRHDERLRLECLAQAMHSNIPGANLHPPTSDELVEIARRFESYVRDPEPAPGDPR